MGRTFLERGQADAPADEPVADDKVGRRPSGCGGVLRHIPGMHTHLTGHGRRLKLGENGVNLYALVKHGRLNSCTAVLHGVPRLYPPSLNLV